MESQKYAVFLSKERLEFPSPLGEEVMESAVIFHRKQQAQLRFHPR
ncbi:hypothetical protein [Nostoc sp.]